MLDWLAFCRGHSIPYVTEGPNTAEGNISIHCPFCGPSDHSEHLGLSLDPRRPAWGCWRNQSHRGQRPHRLIMQLLGVTFAEADELVAMGDVGKIDLFEELANKIRTRQDVPDEKLVDKLRKIRLPKEFKPIVDSGYGCYFVDHLLLDRKFNLWESIVDRYDLRYCMSSHFANRLIVPIRYEGRLVSWTGRTLLRNARVRYLTLAADEERAKRQGYDPALSDLSDVVLNYDLALAGGEVLFVTEGPFDAIKVDWLGRRDGAHAIATFGMPKDGQIECVHKLVEQGGYKQVVVLLDSDAMAQSWRFWDDAGGMRCKLTRAKLPPRVKDPGDLTKDGFKQLLASVRT